MIKKSLVILLSLLTLSSPVFAYTDTPARQLENQLYSNIAVGSSSNLELDGGLKTIVKFMKFIPLIESSDPELSDQFRLGLGDYLSNFDVPINIAAMQTYGPNPYRLVPGITAKSYLVYDIENDVIVLSKDANSKRSIASISKLFTAMVARDKFLPSQNLVMSQAAKTVGSASYLSVGESFSLFDALSYLLIRSSNDVANQIKLFFDQQNYNGGFIALMNQKALEIGLAQTSFSDPSGLSQQNQSSALDLTKTLLYMRQEYPELLALSRQPIVSRDGRVLESSNPIHQYSDIWLGGKNGYISASGRTLASVVEYNGREYIVVTMNSIYDDNAADTLNLLSAIR